MLMKIWHILCFFFILLKIELTFLHKDHKTIVWIWVSVIQNEYKCKLFLYSEFDD